MTARTAALVIDLGFGDAGKGALVDHLARACPTDLVVRFNGGAQAGHNVVTGDGRHHTFAQFGAATLAASSIRTLLSRFVVVHPTALAVEARHLEKKGVSAPLSRMLLDERALITTPWHQAAGRIRELSRGAARHGSCGVGVGETVATALTNPELALHAGDLRDRPRLRQKALALMEAKRRELAPLGATSGDEWAVWNEGDALERWLDAAAMLAPCVVDERAVRAAFAAARGVVFEGAQGVLLDEDHGFHPHTTWSHCTFENALALLEDVAWDGAIERIGILRAYAVRHGAGPLPTEAPELKGVEPHNPENPWQGGFRVGHLDLVLLRYALAACGGVDTLALTHVDEVGPLHRVAVAYEGPMDDALALRDASGAVTALRPVARGDLAHAERLGRALREVRPRLEALDADPVAELEARLGGVARIGFVGRGPRASDYSSQPGIR